MDRAQKLKQLVKVLARTSKSKKTQNAKWEAVRQLERLATPYFYGEEHSADVVAILANALETEQNASIRLSLLVALGNIRYPEIFDILIPFFSDPDEYCSAEAATSALKIDFPRALKELLKLPPLPSLVFNFVVNNIIYEDAIEPEKGDTDLIRFLTRDTTDSEQPGAGLAGLAYWGTEKEIPFVRQYLFHPNFGTHKAAIFALGELGDQASVANLLKIIDSEDEEEKELAIEALGNIGDRMAIPRLVLELDSPVKTAFKVCIALTTLGYRDLLIEKFLLNYTPREKGKPDIGSWLSGQLKAEDAGYIPQIIGLIKTGKISDEHKLVLINTLEQFPDHKEAQAALLDLGEELVRESERFNL